MICDADSRIGCGKNGIEEIKSHPFFYGFDWNNVRQVTSTRNLSPHVPQLKSITDTSYFPIEELDSVPEYVSCEHDHEEEGQYEQGQKDLAFVGYTFKRFDYLTRKDAI